MDRAIDLEALQDLQAMVGVVWKKVATTYFANGEDCLVELAAAVEERNGEALQKIAHAFRSASGQVGALRLQHEMGLIEELGEQGDFAHAAVLLENAKAEFTAVRAELSELMH